MECEGESIDLSGDVGAVGRVVISDNPSGNHDMFLDLKGKPYFFNSAHGVLGLIMCTQLLNLICIFNNLI